MPIQQRSLCNVSKLKIVNFITLEFILKSGVPSKVENTSASRRTALINVTWLILGLLMTFCTNLKLEPTQPTISL